MDTPFALRGYILGTGPKCRMIQHSSSRLEHKTFTTAPSSSPSIVKTSQPSGPRHGSIDSHGSQVSSASMKGASVNRPLSPHLALKKPQLSATYSISHRIFGAALAGAIMLSPIVMKSKVICGV